MKSFRSRILLVLVLIVFGIYIFLYINTDFRIIIASTDPESLSESESSDAELARSYKKACSSGSIQQNDSKLINFIRSKLLYPPASLNVPYNLKNPKNGLTIDTSVGQTTLVQRALKLASILRSRNTQEGGFFVECGGYDGETRSNTLLLERRYHWKGLLIEADPRNFRELLFKQRKSWSINVCLAIQPCPHKVLFNQNQNEGKIVVETDPPKNGSRLKSIDCIPLYSILQAMNVSRIDYLSLDVEGSEIDVLETLPLDYLKNNVNILSVEYGHVKRGRNGRAFVRKWFTSRGFDVFGEVTHPNKLASDWIFVNRKFM